MFKSIKKRLKDQRGLTLVELLAVVVILGIIAGIAVPNIGKIIDKTEKDAKVAEGIQIIQAAKLYATSTKLTFTTVGSGTNIKDEKRLNNGDLSDYLDNVKDKNTDFVVRIIRSNNGKFDYSLISHDTNALSGLDTDGNGEVTEKELLAY